ncbi:hypothetical protein [Virgibacillus dokdonensis]|uniref:Uncharacterized protein n=1 Tax=Virgibacillus dokdonensis TaxID=302167 RepID=A0A2K9J0G4_9BACI|nr:hypothetical protein [Virgibacillus dokdonensis]AUJ25175.1 hypothetical protein A21D_02111 [Virgibacillus dokdonensis]
MTKIYEQDFSQYKLFIEDNFPKTIFNDNFKLNKVFLEVNTSFILADILTEFGFVGKEDSYFILLIEYKRFTGRILSTLLLNDKFLMDNLFRLIIERIYRVLIGLHYPERKEKRLRKSPRSKMSDDLDGKIKNESLAELNDLYRSFSKQIHLTDAAETNQYDVIRLFKTPHGLEVYVFECFQEINKIFIEQIFMLLCKNKQHLVTTGVKARINNNIPEKTANEIIKAIE